MTDQTPGAGLAERDEVLLKALKLLEALQEPCTQVGGEDHSWRLCRRCMAIRQFDFAPDVTRVLIGRVVTELDTVEQQAARLAALEARASTLEDAAFHFQTCPICRHRGEDECPSGARFAAFLRGEEEL